MLRKFLLWWTDDHIQALKKVVVLLAGAAAYLLPKSSAWAQAALLLATGGLTDSTLGSIWKLLQARAAGQVPATVFKDGGAPKALALVLAFGCLLAAAPARAGGFDWSMGPSISFLEYDVGKPNPVQIAPGAGVQVSVTHEALKADVLGKSWDLLSLAGMAFGSVVSPNGAQQFGTLSAALGVCTMSSLLCAGAGKHLLGPSAELVGGGWFWTLTLNFNISLAPTAPSTFDKAEWHLPRGNTLYLVGGP